MNRTKELFPLKISVQLADILSGKVKTMNELTIAALVEVFESLGLRKKHARKLVIDAVFSKQWKVMNSRASVIPLDGYTLEGVTLEFLTKQNITVANDASPALETVQAQEFRSRLLRNS